jgi:HAD superfamily hydrolase (TIGR01509 family)
MIKHIVLDFGGVILDLDGVHTGYPDDLALIFNLPVEETKKIWEKHKTSVITGKEMPRTFLNRIKSELLLELDVEEGIAFWEKRNAISKERIDWELIEILKKLKAGYQVHMLTDQIKLSNNSDLWIDDINKHFHSIFRSYEQGIRKPFPEAYQNLLQKIDAVSEPESVVFIDDNAENIKAANKAGIHGIVYSFKKHVFLREELNRLGVTL